MQFLPSRFALCLVLLFLGGVPAMPGLRAQSTMVLMDSPPGDYIGGGQYYYTTDPAAIQVGGGSGTFEVYAFGFDFWFDGPGEQTFEVGSYPNAVRTPFNGAAPGLSISGNGRGCNTVSASFEILEYEVVDGVIQHLWVKYVHSCEGFMPAARGEIRYRSTLAPAAPEPHTIRVPEDAPTIQAAIGMAQPEGGTIDVGPGTYAGPIDFRSRQLRVVSRSGPATTVLVGVPDAPTVAIGRGQGPETRLEGFTLQGGAGGILIDRATPTIVGNVITQAAYGIYANFGSPVIVSNRIVGYGEIGGRTAGGNGIDLFGTVGARVEFNRIERNNFGIVASNAGATLVRNNIIQFNLLDGLQLGSRCDLDIVQNVIARNFGNGITAHVVAGARGPLVEQNTFVNNGGDGFASDGFNELTVLRYNVFYYDRILFNAPLHSILPTIQTNDVFVAGGSGYGGLLEDLTGTAGNISVDPRFLDFEAGNYRLRASSPVLDVTAPDPGLPFDMDGAPRAVARDGTSIPMTDLGAFEYQPGPPRPTPYVSASSNPERVRVDWATFDDAVRYEVRRAEHPEGPWTVLGEASAGPFDDIATVAGTTYLYAVAGINSWGEGAASAPIAVRAGNHAPSAVDDLVSGDEDTILSVPLLANDSDADGDGLTFSLLTLPANLTVTLKANAVELTGPQDWSGTNVFTYLLRDSQGASSTGQVTVIVRPVNDPPYAYERFFQVLAPNALDCVMDAFDVEQDPLTLEVVTPPSLGLAVSLADRPGFRYVPAHGATGRDSLVVRILDRAGGRSGPVQVWVDVFPPADLDQDGMSDEWENLWDLNNPLADPDGDGVTSRQEYLGLTSPRDASSRLTIQRISMDPEGNARLEWPSVGGVRYRVQGADDGGPWTDLTHGVIEEMEAAAYGQPAMRSFVDVRPQGNVRLRLYRVAAVAN